MKGNLIKKFGNIGVVFILTIGALSLVGLFSNLANAEAINGVQVIAADGEISFDENGDGYIDAEGNDDIGIKWDVDYAPATTYVRIISGFKITNENFYDDGNCKRMVRWCNEVMCDVFGSKNTIQIWHGSKRSGYSEIKFNLPKRVEEFPINFKYKFKVYVDYLNGIKESDKSNDIKTYSYTVSESDGKNVVYINRISGSNDANNVETYTNTATEGSNKNVIFSDPYIMKNTLLFKTLASCFLIQNRFS